MTQQEIPDEDAVQFIGPNSDYYLARWRGTGGRTPPLLGFHWPAFFLGMGWMLYRRMYKAFWIALGSLIGGTILVDYLFGTLPSIVDRGLTLGIAVTFGQFANYWYYRHALRLYRSEPARFADHGGVRWWPALTFVGVIVLVVGLAVSATM